MAGVKAETRTAVAGKGASEAAPIAAQVYTEESDSENYDDELSFTTSVASSVREYQYEHGRRYHAYQAGRYNIPNDEDEQNRLELQYHALHLSFGGRLFYAPIGEKPTAILDVGTGTGTWAIEVADEYPSATVTGTDLSPIQYEWAPANVRFEVDDVEADWTFAPASFDLVHARMMNGSIRDWPAFFRNAFTHVRPGGWVECQEISIEADSDDGTLRKDSSIRRWCDLQIEAGLKANMDFRMSGDLLKKWMEEAGFVNVDVRPFKIPIGTWPADKRLRDIGAVQLVAMLEGLESLTLGFYTRLLGWTPQKVQEFLVPVRQEFRSRNIHAYWPLYAVCGQKPATAT